jgi:hypothetical protein
MHILTQHKNMPFICKIEEEIVTKTYEDLRQKYLKATDAMKTKEDMLSNLGEMFANQQQDILKTVTKIKENIQELQVLPSNQVFP